MSGLQKARRAHSMPSRFIMPSATIGEYELDDSALPSRRRSAPSRPHGGLYPLSEEGAYGAAPAAPPAPRAAAPQFHRDRKPKVYSSYAVDSKCSVHSKKLEKQEKDHGQVRRPSSQRSSQSPGRRTVSASPSRAVSSDRTSPHSSASQRSSKSPEPARKNSYGSYKDIGPVVDTGRKPSRKNSKEAPGYSSTSWTSSASSSTVAATSSTSSMARGKKSSSSSQRHSTASSSSGYRYHDLKNSSFEENEEDEYVRKHSDFGRDIDYRARGGATTKGGVSLEGLRKPKIDSWDSMGILGLTTKIWNDTQKRQETFLQSTGHFLREEAHTTYVM